jgi:SAM-dependent methyltransferase
MSTMLQALPGDTARFLRLVELLRCPATGRPYRYEPVAQRDAELGVYGVLHGDDGPWPVIDSIPILLDAPVGAYEHYGRQTVLGPTPSRLVEMIRAGRGREALIECLAVPYVPGANAQDPQGWLERRLYHHLRRHVVRPGTGRRIRRRQLARLLARESHRLTATDLIRFFYGPGSPLPHGYLHYFLYRYCLPRSLAAVSLMSLIPPTPRPVLDLACGFGHFAHFLTGQPVTDWMVGADFNFIPMWAARRTSAPQASFVLLDAGAPLPFRDDAFGAALCSDAFTYIPRKRELVAEMARVAGDHPLVFPRLYNRTALPQAEAEEMSAAEYRALFGAPERTWIASEDALVRCYLDGRSPDLRRQAAPASMTHDKFLSAFVRPAGMPAAAPRRFAAWPHSAGRLQLNPIFTPRPAADGGIEIEAWFDNPHFCLQNAGATSYMPRRARIPAETLARLREGAGGGDVEALVRSFVLLGLPERYAPDPLSRPLAQ